MSKMDSINPIVSTDMIHLWVFKMHTNSRRPVHLELLTMIEQRIRGYFFGRWHLRASAGGSFSRFSGSIISDQPIEMVTGIKLESSDQVATANPSELTFQLEVGGIGEDGIDFRIPVGASAEFTLSHFVNDATSLLRVGGQQWPVSALPLNLSGWDAPPENV